jgi:hypothetical protein
LAKCVEIANPLYSYHMCTGVTRVQVDSMWFIYKVSLIKTLNKLE